MLPYVPQPHFSIGPLTFSPFGLLCVTAIVVGREASIRRATRLGLPDVAPNPFTIAVIGCGYLGAHLDKVILDNPRAFLADPTAVFRDWSGIASFGGFLGGLLGAFLWMRHLRLTWAEQFRFLDVFAWVFPFAWIFGRLGCTLANDHRGLWTLSRLAVRYPEGPRYNLGLIELIFTILLAVLFLLLDRRPWPVGFYIGVLPIVYGAFRLYLDTLHDDPIRYFGVTLDQIGGVATVTFGAVALALLRRRSRSSSDAFLSTPQRYPPGSPSDRTTR